MIGQKSNLVFFVQSQTTYANAVLVNYVTMSASTVFLNAHFYDFFLSLCHVYNETENSKNLIKAENVINCNYT